MSKSKFEISKENGPHLRLNNLIGNWEGNTRTWFEKDKLADESYMKAKITGVFDHRFISYEYVSTLEGKKYEGKMLWAYDLGNDKCQCSWVDTFHMGTAIMLSEGKETSNGFVVLGQYSGPEIPLPWSWRTELEIINPNQFIIRAFNISPAGDEAKATETIYHRIVDLNPLF
jgi:hypothetical protein